MEKQELLEQANKAFSKYRYYDVFTNNGILASYWLKKYRKYEKKRQLAAALIKRQIKANGITKLNLIKI